MIEKNINQSDKKFTTNKTFLITGGTGSFGETIVKFLLKMNVHEIRVLSRDEKKQDDLRNKLSSNKVKFYIGDVRDKDSLSSAFKNVDYVFHAAALKQVPSCEFFPLEAIKTNVYGTENVANACLKNNVKKMILLSTDKAVYPVNSMGMTKALAEKIIISKSSTLETNNTILCSTRYGNVMGTRGSVIPLFIDQIKSRKNITLTDPKMTRFIMSLNDSVGLVMHAFESAKSSEIYVKKTYSAKVLDIATTLKDIFNSSVKIKTIGTRHGEKKFETLVSKEEFLRTVDKKNYYLIKPDLRNLNYNKYFSEGEVNLKKIEGYSSDNTKLLNTKDLKRILLQQDFIKKELKSK